MNELVPQKSWFSRNWPWAVPLGGCLTLILLFVFGIGAAVIGISSAITGSTPYENAVYEASHNENVIGILGNPIETNGIMQGNISTTNDSGDVDLRIPLKGPNGNATVHVIGEKENDEWTYEEMYVTIDESGEKIDLLDGISNDF